MRKASVDECGWKGRLKYLRNMRERLDADWTCADRELFAGPMF
jgi:hypothetical protein